MRHNRCFSFYTYRWNYHTKIEPFYCHVWDPFGILIQICFSLASKRGQFFLQQWENVNDNAESGKKVKWVSKWSGVWGGIRWHGTQRARFTEKVHKPPLGVNVINFELNWFNASIWVPWSPSDPKKS